MLPDTLIRHTFMPEEEIVAALLGAASLSPAQLEGISKEADALVTYVRGRAAKPDMVDAFMHAYELSTQEGVLLMCLAEALLRIPDTATARELLRDKLGQADFEKYLGQGKTSLTRASTRALKIAADLLRAPSKESWASRVKGLVAKSGEPVIRRAAFQAMRLLSNKFVMGHSIGQALERAKEGLARGYSYSFDMLGEGAKTAPDAAHYWGAYAQAIDAIAQFRQGPQGLGGPGISIKLSALHPRYEFAQKARVLLELVPRVKELCVKAKAANMMLTIDAEEAERLELSLEVFALLARDEDLAGWDGLGLAVQAYQKRALPVLAWLRDLALETKRRLPVRLVKGAYWDTQIKRAQEKGLSDFPVFTRKAATDVSYVACAKYLLSHTNAFYPAFATHNARTVATILSLGSSPQDFEFQRLFGMGEALYEPLVGERARGYTCRVYAPVGAHKDLLPYLVRRLLENGANSSFVNKIADPDLPLSVLNADPAQELAGYTSVRHPGIARPRDIFGAARIGAQGLELTHPTDVDPVLEALARPWRTQEVRPLVSGKAIPGEEAKSVLCPFDHETTTSHVESAQVSILKSALGAAHRFGPQWRTAPVLMRAEILMRAADLLEARRLSFMALLCHEGGKTIPDALAEVREAIDFCRYYADQGRQHLDQPTQLPGPTGERNTLSLEGRGVFACISPWNFPLAIFMGQVAAALMAGNTVLAKPASQTPLVALRAVELLLEAGVPPEALHFVPTSGRLFGQTILGDPRLGGVAFTGSTYTAWDINTTLAQKKGVIVPLIAETGGQNVMIVDSSALLEQVVQDVLASAFQSAGQRCSALRILFVQDDIAPRLMKMLTGAMEELTLGDPRLLSTDVGPVIDQGAKDALLAHAGVLSQEATLLHRVAVPNAWEARGTFVGPSAYEISSLDTLKEEHFGPILHVMRFSGDRLWEVVDQVNALGFGLTFGLHTRLDGRAQEVATRVRAGNIYINRNMIGAVVGSQPFGGQGLSGTGPKAGGPHYLPRFMTEKTVSVDITAQGGNASLMTLV
ncbi:MAG: bifunctional proline dehydrogenase/L-glutamate gamma-semialdehyde dehydrogenase [Candidatus Puniceispirillum sp.]|nr:bifunctional proline dehydrogenase/L-glutamate gamma-semialdehyde dehydrogenase [Candidatus Puniceispirillum sp.]